MKNSIFQSALILFSTVTIISCNKDNSKDASPLPQPIIENNWKLNEYNFSRSTSYQNSTTYTNGNPFTQVNVDSKISNDNGSFKTCNVVFWFNTSTDGIYKAKSVDTMLNSVKLKYMNIKCMVSNAAGAGAIYESVNTNIAVTVKKVNNKFVITASEPITLNKTLDDGLVNAPTSMTFTCDNLR